MIRAMQCSLMVELLLCLFEDNGEFDRTAEPLRRALEEETARDDEVTEGEEDEGAVRAAELLERVQEEYVARDAELERVATEEVALE